MSLKKERSNERLKKKGGKKKAQKEEKRKTVRLGERTKIERAKSREGEKVSLGK